MSARLNINSQRDLEKEFTHLVKLFEGKETELNWTARNNAIVRLRKIVNEQNDEWRDTLLSGIRELATGIVKTIHSMRTTFATEALLLISDISLVMGNGLDNYTVDLFFNNLIKLSGVTKRIIVDKSTEVTNTFLENTTFHTKILNILYKAMQERNMQTKQACTTFLKTILERHADNESTRMAMDKAGASEIIVQFLKRGLSDASPKVRENSRQLYWLFHKYWPESAETMMQSMDSKTLSPLKRVTSMTPPSRAYSLSHLPKPSSNLRPPLKRSLSSATSSPSLRKRPNIPTTNINITTKTIQSSPSMLPTPSPSSSYKLNRLSHISNISAPPSSTPTHSNKLTSASTPTRRTKSDYHQQSTAIAMLQMLQSKDPDQITKALRTLCEKMKHVYYQPHQQQILPPDIPPKVTLSLTIMDFLSNHHLHRDIYKALMNWDCLASVVVNILAFNYYAPTLIIAKEEDEMSIYGKGLMRLKLFLKRKDPDLAQELVNLLRACKNRDNKVLDSSVRRDLLVYPSYRSSLLIGLLKWLDEIVCDYVGLAEEEDHDMVMEGSRYLDGESVSEQWFDVDDNINISLELVFSLLSSYEEEGGERSQHGSATYYDCICVLLAHLKLANERMFERAILTVEDSTIVYMALGIHQPQDEEELEQGNKFQDLLDISFGSIELEDMEPEPPINEAAAIETWDNILDHDYCEDEHTGMTQAISDLNFGLEIKKINIKLSNGDKDGDSAITTASKSIAVKADNEGPPITSRIRHIRSSSSINNDENYLKKKRRLLRSDPKTQQASNLISELELEPKRALFLQLETVPNQVWFDEESLFYSLIDVLVEVLSTNPTIRLQATRFLKSLIQDKVLVENLLSPKLTFKLLKALFDGWKDKYNHIQLVAEETVLSLLCEDRTALKLLWNLANEYFEQRIDNALPSLLNFISKKAVKTPGKVLEESLKESNDILVKCFSHNNTAVRKSCVHASVGIYQVLGDSFIKNYLAPLKSDQLHLLNHYISRVNE